MNIEETAAQSFRWKIRSRKKEIIWGEDNVFKKFLVDKGNVDEAWAHADFIVEGEYDTGAQEQLYIENNGVIAIANADGRRDRLGIDAVSLLRSQGAGEVVWPAGRKDSRDSN